MNSLQNGTSNNLKVKDLTKQEKRLIASTVNVEDEKAEDVMIALQLLNQYKKDPNFIQKEL